jgi:hypothetical protein
MMQNNNNIVFEKRGRGRPRIVDKYGIKPSQQKELVECVNCLKVFDLHSRTLDQSIIDDTKFCFSCFEAEIMNKSYEDPLDKEIRDFWRNSKIRYGNV